MTPPITDFVTPHPTILTLDSTKLNAYQTCPRRFFFEYVLGWRPETTSIHLTFGVAWHLAMDHLMQHGCSPANADIAFQLFLAKWRESVSEPFDLLHEPKDPANAYAALQLYAATYQTERFTVLHKEIPGIITIADENDPAGWEREMHVNIDVLVQWLDDNTISFLDHKTTTQDSRSWREGFSLSLQIGAYIHALYGLTDPSNVRGAVINGAILRKNKTGKGMGNAFTRIEILRTPDQQQAWLDEVVNTYRDLENSVNALFASNLHLSESFPLFPRRTVSCTKYGSVCPYHGFCSTVRNPLHLAAGYGPGEAPPGFIREYWNPVTHEGERPFGSSTEEIILDKFIGECQRP